MKTARRHELRENDLAQQIGMMMESLRKHGVAIFVVTVLVVVVIVAVSIYTSNRAEALDDAWNMLETPPSGVAPKAEDRISHYQELANKNLDPSLTALALKSAADSALSAMIDAQVRGDGATASKMGEQARGLFNRLKSEYGDSDRRMIAADAMMGLAYLDESKGDKAAAEAGYKAVMNDPRFKYMPFSNEAKFRLDNLAKWQEKIVFAPASRPAPASGPAASTSKSPLSTITLPSTRPTVIPMAPKITPMAPSTRPAGAVGPTSPRK